MCAPSGGRVTRTSGRGAEAARLTLPATSLGDTSVAEQAVLNALAGTEDVGIPYPIPASNSMPSQETTPARPPVPS